LIKWEFSEAELRERFINALETSSNILIHQEVPVFSRSVDLVLQDLTTSYITAVEFKMHDWKRAILQAQSVGICFDFLCICLPKPKTQVGCHNIMETCEVNGVGLYLYDSEINTFEKVIDSPRTTTVWEIQKKRVINYLEAKEHGRGTTHP
jgi:hypothetical protein